MSTESGVNTVLPNNTVSVASMRCRREVVVSPLLSNSSAKRSVRSSSQSLSAQTPTAEGAAAGLFPEQETLAARAPSPNRMTWIVRFIIFFTLGCPEKSLYSLRVSFSTIPSFHALKSPARMCSRAAPTSRR